MKKLIGTAISAIILMGPNAAVALIYEDDLNPTSFGPVEVTVDDDATGGCWTNLGEAKVYAEDKLRNLGYTITVQTQSGDGHFFISVNSARLNSRCYGSVGIQMGRYSSDKDLFGFL